MTQHFLLILENSWMSRWHTITTVAVHNLQNFSQTHCTPRMFSIVVDEKICETIALGLVKVSWINPNQFIAPISKRTWHKTVQSAGRVENVNTEKCTVWPKLYQQQQCCDCFGIDRKTAELNNKLRVLVAFSKRGTPRFSTFSLWNCSNNKFDVRQ